MLPALALAVAAATGVAGRPPCPFTGSPEYAPSAGCLTAVDGRLLVVEYHSGKLSPPGGKAKEGESAQCAAHRETYEETGLDLLPVVLAATFDTGFKLYFCNMHSGSGELHVDNPLEIRRARWLPLDQVPKSSWRFPGQGEALVRILRQDKQ